MSPAVFTLWLATHFAVNLTPATWNTDYAQAVKKARTEHRPLVVVLEDRTQSKPSIGMLDHPLVRLTLANCSVCRLDVKTRSGAEVAARLRAQTFPYTVVSDRSGRRIVFRSSGEVDDGTMLRLLGAVMETSLVSDEETVGSEDSSVEHRLRVVLISSDGCAYCERMKAETLPDPAVGRVLEQGMNLEYVNATEDDTLTVRHQLQVYPTILVIKPDGRLVDRIDGYVSPSELVPRLEACAAAR